MKNRTQDGLSVESFDFSGPQKPLFDQMKKLFQDNQKLMESIGQLQEKCKKLNEEITIREREQGQLKCDYDDLVREVEIREESSRQTEDILQQLKVQNERLQQLQKENDNFRSELENQIVKLEQEVRCKDDQIRQIREELLSQKERLDQESPVSSSEGSSSEDRGFFDEERRKWATQRQELTTYLQEIVAECEVLREELQRLRSLNVEIEAEKESLCKQVLILNDRLRTQSIGGADVTNESFIEDYPSLQEEFDRSEESEIDPSHLRKELHMLKESENNLSHLREELFHLSPIRKVGPDSTQVQQQGGLGIIHWRFCDGGSHSIGEGISGKKPSLSETTGNIKSKRVRRKSFPRLSDEQSDRCVEQDCVIHGIDKRKSVTQNSCVQETEMSDLMDTCQAYALSSVSGARKYLGDFCQRFTQLPENTTYCNITLSQNYRRATARYWVQSHGRYRSGDFVIGSKIRGNEIQGIMRVIALRYEQVDIADFLSNSSTGSSGEPESPDDFFMICAAAQAAGLRVCQGDREIDLSKDDQEKIDSMQKNFRPAPSLSCIPEN